MGPRPSVGRIRVVIPHILSMGFLLLDHRRRLLLLLPLLPLLLKIHKIQDTQDTRYTHMCYTDTQDTRYMLHKIQDTQDTSYTDTRYIRYKLQGTSQQPHGRQMVSSKTFGPPLVGAADAGSTAICGADSSSNCCFFQSEDEHLNWIPHSSNSLMLAKC